MDPVTNVQLVAAAKGGAGQFDFLTLVTGSGGVVMAVLVLLVLFSVACWGIIIYKYIVVRRAQGQSMEFLEAFWGSKRLDAIAQACDDLVGSPLAQVFRAGYVELTKVQRAQAGGGEETMGAAMGGVENVQRAMRRAANSEMTNLERYVPFLATTASSAPFVGLFGTVWGIMKSFIEIGRQGSAGLTTVAPGIAEALIATAVGLAAAIPAVIAYNYFLAKIRVLESETENFSSDFLNIVKRHFLK